MLDTFQVLNAKIYTEEHFQTLLEKFLIQIQLQMNTVFFFEAQNLKLKALFNFGNDPIH